MPQIPQYIAKGNLTNEAPLVKKNISEELRVGTGAALQTMAEGFSDLGEKIRKVDAANAESKAEVERQSLELEDETRRSKLEPLEALQDLEESSKKRTQELAKKHFRDPVARANYLRKAELYDAEYTIKQKAQIAKRVVGERRVLVNRDLELEKSNAINAQTEQDRLVYDQKMEEVVNNPANTDIFTPEEKYKLLEDARKDVKQGVKDRASLDAKKAKEVALAREFAKSQQENDLIKKRVDNQLTFEEIRNAMDGDNPIDARVGQSLINSLKSPKTVAPKTDYGVYEKIMTDIVSSSKSASDIKADILEAHKEGFLNDRDFKSLLYSKQMGNDPIFALASQEQSKPETTNKFQPYWDAVSGAFSSPVDKGMVMSSITSQLNGAETAVELAKITKNEITKRLYQIFSWMSLIPKAGTQIMDTKGNLKTITPDGELTDTETKSAKPESKE